MCNSYDPVVIKALEGLSKVCSRDELLDYRFAVAAVLDLGIGDIPEVDLVLLAHKQGVARAVADTRGRTLSDREVKRLTQYATRQLFGASEDAALFVVKAWAGAFGKKTPTRKIPKPATPQKNQAPKPQKKKPTRPATNRRFNWKAFSRRCFAAVGVLAVVVAAVVGMHVLSLRSTPTEKTATVEESPPPVSAATATDAVAEAPALPSRTQAAAPPQHHLPNTPAGTAHVEAAQEVPPQSVVQQRQRRSAGSWERFQSWNREQEERRERLDALRKKNNIPPPPEGYEWRYYPNDPRAKYAHRSSYPYMALPPQRHRGN